MRLKFQMFITLLIASALLIAVMFTASSTSFSRGFLSYINNAENERLQVLATVLEDKYAKDGNWDNTLSTPKIWRKIINTSGIENRQQEQRGHRSKHKSPLHERIHRRLILADKYKQPLIGSINKKTEPKWRAINHQDEVVGYLGINPLRRLDNQFDQAFERRQKRSFALAGLSMVLLSGLLAVPLASRTVKPIVNLQQTVAEISRGNYAHRIETKRRDEIGDLAKDINTLSETLAHSQDARKRLFAEISHELRTPVTVLRSQLEAIQDGVHQVDNESINSLHAETIKLNRLIEDLQTLSLADAGALDYQMARVDLSQLLHEYIAQGQSTEPELDFTLQIEPSTQINADEQRIGQMISNLMQNSLRYTNKPGSVTVTLTRHHDRVELTWADSAPGVSDIALEKLFDPLYRTEKSRSRKHGGAGLGLAIVKKIVDAHGGSCNATHAKAGGLSINITFPLDGQHQ